MNNYNHSLSIDNTIMILKNKNNKMKQKKFPIIGEHIGVIFVTQ